MSSENQIAHWTRDWALKAGLVHWYESQTESTNTVAKADLSAPGRSAYAHVLYITGHQTQGRGRGQNSWSDTKGALLSSWSFHMAQAPQPIFAPLAGLAVFNAAMKIWPNLAWSLKAPNDIYLGPHKVAGLLIETVEQGPNRRSIVGLGLNVFDVPQGIDTATSLQRELGDQAVTQESWNSFLQALLVNFIATVPLGQKTDLAARESSALLAALNRRPNLEQRILQVGSKGELHTTGGLIEWQSL